MRFLASVAATVLMILARPVHAAPVRVAVADFDYTDSSGEVTDQRAAHADRLRAFKAAIIDDLRKDPRITALPLACTAAPCSANDLDQSGIVAAAKAQDAKFVIFGGVRKMSTLIQWGEIGVMDTATGKAALSRTVTFRGDSAEAWQHAADYVGQMMASAMNNPQP